MQIIDYFQVEDQAHWRTQIASYEWRAAKLLARLLENGEFHANVGEGTLYLLTDGDKLVSFATLAEKDCLDVPYGPWIGFVHTAPEYRGHRHVGKLIDHACQVAGAHGVQRVYICTDHVGLYEKYGFTYLENQVSIYGEDSRVYVREAVQIQTVTCDNFGLDSLDGFIRHQEVSECWRNVDGVWNLLPIIFVEDWQTPRLREEAAEILQRIREGGKAVGAFVGGEVVGFAVLGRRLGSRRQYIELTSLHVSEPYRRQGIGGRLFAAICDAARTTGAEKLYISAHSSKESQAAYRALGCVHAQEADEAHVAAEPWDVQMEYDLKGSNRHG